MEETIRNQNVKCIIYYNNGNCCKAKRKLKEIIEEKIRCGINMTLYYETFCDSEAKFKDGEEWKILNANNARGYLWHKAYIDNDIPKEVIASIIEPCGVFYKREDYKKY